MRLIVIKYLNRLTALVKTPCVRVSNRQAVLELRAECVRRQASEEAYYAQEVHLFYPLLYI